MTRVRAHSGPLMPCLTPHVFSGYVSVCLLSDEHLEAAVADGWVDLSRGNAFVSWTPWDPV